LVPQTCVGGAAFSPNGQFLIYTEFNDRGCVKGESHVLRIASLGSLDEAAELIYKDNWGGLDTVVSPDGAFLATNAQGSSEFVYPAGDASDINPRIVTIELARPVPEFGQAYTPAMFAIAFGLIISLYLGTRITKLRHSYVLK
ncbi:MAG: hypothetical protein ACREBU_15515, partial [Nitrososphaera sp.]